MWGFPRTLRARDLSLRDLDTPGDLFLGDALGLAQLTQAEGDELFLDTAIGGGSDSICGKRMGEWPSLQLTRAAGSLARS
jgi:hypothetical protein